MTPEKQLELLELDISYQQKRVAAETAKLYDLQAERTELVKSMGGLTLEQRESMEGDDE